MKADIAQAMFKAFALRGLAQINARVVFVQGGMTERETVLTRCLVKNGEAKVG